MSLRVKIFLLSMATTVLAIAATGVAGLYSGRSAIVGAALDSLEREMGAQIAALEGTQRAMRHIAEAFPGNTLYRLETISTLRSFLSSRGPEILGQDAELEIRLPSGERIFILGSLNAEAGLKDRPEFEAAAEGSSYLIRRSKLGPALYYAERATIAGVDVVACSAAVVDTLDYFQRFHIALLAGSSLAAAALLLAASYVISRQIARRLDEGFRRMSESIRDKVERLEAEKADRQAFIDDLTHELRTPVTSIVGFAELLRSRSWDESVFADGLQRIEAEGKRILALSESLRRLLVARTGSRDFEELEARAFLAGLAEDHLAAASAASVSLELDADPGSVRIDPSLMSIALRNLIDNSIRASAPGSRVVLGFRREGESRRLFVRDFGPGMSDAQIARAGRPFPRPSGAILDDGAHRGCGVGGGGGSEGRGGLGLGLAICKEIAESHGAELAFEAPADGGFLVAIDFPNLQSVYPSDAEA